MAAEQAAATQLASRASQESPAGEEAPAAEEQEQPPPAAGQRGQQEPPRGNGETPPVSHRTDFIERIETCRKFYPLASPGCIAPPCIIYMKH